MRYRIYVDEINGVKTGFAMNVDTNNLMSMQTFVGMILENDMKYSITWIEGIEEEQN